MTNLSDFLKVKKVRCVSIGGHSSITAGKEYDVVGVDRDSVFIVNDDERECFYSYKHFEPVLDSAENPLQKMELTPEYEQKQSEPKFKVGDKVYYRAYADICVVSDVSDIGEVQIKGWMEDYYNSRYFCHATKENYEMLCNLYPHIEFEQPAKELSGSDLARALIKKGWVGFNCLCGNSGDGHVITHAIVTGINNSGQFTTVDGRLFNNAVPMLGSFPLTAEQVGLSSKC